MIRKLEGKREAFVIDTPETSLVLLTLPTGQIETAYYGKRIAIESACEAESLSEKNEFPPGNSIDYNSDPNPYTLEDVRLLVGTYGKGDLREPMIEAVSCDGNSTLDFVLTGSLISDGKNEIEGLPSSHDSEGALSQTLTLIMTDKNNGYVLKLYFSVFSDSDVIARSVSFENRSGKKVRLERLLSGQLDIFASSCRVISFTGAWTREMNRNDTIVSSGNYSISTIAGSSSSRANPFFIVASPDATEEYGRCMASNLIYSGNHYESVSVSTYGKTRILTGISPEGFSFELVDGEVFNAPECLMAFSDQGFSRLSIIMADFVREHILTGEWAKKPRPVLLNSWEAAYFDINEKKLLSFAKKGRELGAELFVMDDGWFGNRNDDRSSLGDWKVNLKKLPHGLSCLCDRIHGLGMYFGIWVEPEMVNVDSDLYRAHPDWTIQTPDSEQSEGRHQRILDLSNPEVADYVYKAMCAIFSSASIDYVKWDYNRIFSDVYSPYLKERSSGELYHRYILGLYHIMDGLVKKYPHILFEGCASGGNRFDLGILSYFPQIWGSDNSDAISRLTIQQGYSMGYPMSCVTGHVSACPNHQTLRVTPLDTRFNVAAFTSFGMEMNPLDMSSQEIHELSGYVDLYKKLRTTMQGGDFYRMSDEDNTVKWVVTDKDGSRSVGMVLVKEIKPGIRYENLKFRGLDPCGRYHVYNLPVDIDVRTFGSMINQVSPVHVKPGSLAEGAIAHFVKIHCELLEENVSGSLLMNAGINLPPAFTGTGYNERVRVMGDFASRLYIVEKVDRDSLTEDSLS
ncbi:alpha-galactosidase [Candidatus Weimeria sp. HCP3S3_B5]|uniref:alpha-galactosidase n=1 Tax=Candidatus Weimeria sp. HCP3S3_B5 TaxID=3438871 RepID=UPI003F8A5084